MLVNPSGYQDFTIAKERGRMCKPASYQSSARGPDIGSWIVDLGARISRLHPKQLG